MRLDRNQRQSKTEERVLGRNTACPGGSMQPRGGESYGGRGGQITWRTGGGYKGGGEGNMFNRGGAQTGPRRDPNAMDIDRGREGIGLAMYVESGAIWPKIVGKDIKEE